MDFSENKPIYQQISEFFCNQILMKKWKTGDRIPSVREMAVTMEVNPNTAICAFHSLQEKEILYNERGVGYFVAEDAFSKVMTLKRQEFIEEKLPRLMQDLDQLDISPGDLNELYEKHHK